MNIEQIAKIAHELNKQYCVTLGDDSQPAWEDAPEWQKDSIINGVKAHLNDPNLTGEESHNLWLKQKADEGWSWGPTKDAETKIHPCFRPYNELPLDMKVKDYLFSTIVNQLKPFYEEECEEECKAQVISTLLTNKADSETPDGEIDELEQKRILINAARDLFNEHLCSYEDVLSTLDLTDGKKCVIRDTMVRKYLKDNNYLPELQELLK